MKYEIDYQPVKDGLTDDDIWDFNKVRDYANEYELELSDDDFMRFLKIHKSDGDVGFLMNQMSTYNQTLTDALVTYVCF